MKTWSLTPSKNAEYYTSSGIKHVLARVDTKTLQVYVVNPGMEREDIKFKFDSVEQAKRFVENYFGDIE